MQLRSLTAQQGASALSLTRIFKILEVAHELVRTGRSATQRDLYYRLKDESVFKTPRDVNEAIQDVVAALLVPRSALGIHCSSRGAVAGRLLLLGPTGDVPVDCTTVSKNGLAIPGDLQAVESFLFQSDARSVNCSWPFVATSSIHPC